MSKGLAYRPRIFTEVKMNSFCIFHLLRKLFFQKLTLLTFALAHTGQFLFVVPIFSFAAKDSVLIHFHHKRIDEELKCRSAN